MQGATVVAPHRFSFSPLFANIANAPCPFRLGHIGASIKQSTNLRERLLFKQRQDEAVRRVLQLAKASSNAKPEVPKRRSTASALSSYFDVSFQDENVIRPIDRYHSNTYSLSKRVLGLADYLFVRYPVPLFLYRSVLTWQGIELIFGEQALRERNLDNAPYEWKFRSWFYAVAQGKSLAKVAKNDFTKREAHFFLLAPPTGDIVRNIYWAKLVAAGLNEQAATYLTNRCSAQLLSLLGDRLQGFATLFEECWKEMFDFQRAEVTDFLQVCIQTANFSFKGRTYGSISKLSHEWHQGVYLTSRCSYETWQQTFETWQSTKKSVTTRFQELTNTRALFEEGTRQRHCVYTYRSRCLSRRTSIVSLRWYDGMHGVPEAELGRLTIEVCLISRSVVQVRGKQNCRPTEEQISLIRAWAGMNGLAISPCAC